MALVLRRVCNCLALRGGAAAAAATARLLATLGKRWLAFLCGRCVIGALWLRWRAWLVQDPELTPEVIAALRVEFERIDADGSGKIDLEEVKALFKAAGEEATEVEIRSMVSEADKNSDSLIDFDEFLEVRRCGSARPRWLILARVGGISRVRCCSGVP
jgi:hypothetical protein